MFIDASVIAAVLKQEADASDLADRLRGLKGRCYVSPIVRFEAVLAVARSMARETGLRPTPAMLSEATVIVDEFVREIEAENVMISEEIGSGAIEASRLYGKAVGHPADLNFGDCFHYACAKALKVPLLYRGGDFAETDLG